MGYREVVQTVLNQSNLPLPTAPKFGPNGAWPPVMTEWTMLRNGLFSVEFTRGRDLGAAAAAGVLMNLASIVRQLEMHGTRVPRGRMADYFTEQGIMHENYLGFLLEKIPPEIVRIGQSSIMPGGLLELQFSETDAANWTLGDAEVRRFVHSQRWQRTDPVTQLPPDTSHEMTYSLTIGLSFERSQTLAAALGMEIGANIAGLQAKFSPQLQYQFGLKLDINAQEQRSSKLTLTNPGKHTSRLYSLWHIENRIAVDRLKIPVQDMRLAGSRSNWEQIETAEFATDNVPHITYTDITHS
jgi:hypothetical protein